MVFYGKEYSGRCQPDEKTGIAVISENDEWVQETEWDELYEKMLQERLEKKKQEKEI